MDINRLPFPNLEREKAGRAAVMLSRGVMGGAIRKPHNLFGAHGARETPVPMPNTAVKPRSGYNTWGSPLGK